MYFISGFLPWLKAEYVYQHRSNTLLFSDEPRGPTALNSGFWTRYDSVCLPLQKTVHVTFHINFHCNNNDSLRYLYQVTHNKSQLHTRHVTPGSSLLRLWDDVDQSALGSCKRSPTCLGLCKAFRPQPLFPESHVIGSSASCPLPPHVIIECVS